MAQAVIGQVFTFQVLFLDDQDNPMVVDNPTLWVFYYSDAGAKQTLLDGEVLAESVPAEVGRYAHTMTIPNTFNDGDVLYVEMQGEDPMTGVKMRTEQQVDLISEYRGAEPVAPLVVGITARFIK